MLKSGTGWTEIFIYPGYRFKVLDALITNFHLPQSTLVMLVSALAGREHILNAYREAVKERYRFFSFGMPCLSRPIRLLRSGRDCGNDRRKREKMEERLNKWLSRMGVCSRREADRLIEAGKVLVDNRPASMGQKVTPGQKVVCNGRMVRVDKSRKPRPVLLAVNKPRGIVCTTTDKDRAENIVDFLGYPERIYPVGRLDKDSEGLLLMTNQGDLVNKIMRSGNAHEKEYIVTIDKPVTEHFLEQMAGGIRLPELDQVTRPCKVKRWSGIHFPSFSPRA